MTYFSLVDVSKGPDSRPVLEAEDGKITAFTNDRARSIWTSAWANGVNVILDRRMVFSTKEDDNWFAALENWSLVHGFGLSVDSSEKNFPFPASWLLADEKFNPYHDARGRFSSGNAATFVSFKPGTTQRPNVHGDGQTVGPEPPKPSPKPSKPQTGAEARRQLADLERENKAEGDRLEENVRLANARVNQQMDQPGSWGSTMREREKAEREGDKEGLARIDAQRARYERDLNARIAERDAARLARTEHDREVNRQAFDLVARQSLTDPIPFTSIEAGRGKFTSNEKIRNADGHHRFAQLVGPGHLEGQTVYMSRESKGRSNYDLHNGVHMDKNANKHVVVHEMSHWLEDKNPGVHRDAVAFLDRRTRGESPQPLTSIKPGSGYGKDEVSTPDKFIDPYVGKRYNASMNRNYATEVVSMGMEYMSKDPIGFAKKDPEHFDLIFDTVRRNAKK